MNLIQIWKKTAEKQRLVWNSFSWPRTEVVHVNGGGELGEEEPNRVKRARLEQNCQRQTLHDGSEIGMLF